MDRDGREMLFEVREVDRDVSFLRRFLTKRLIRELGLFEFARKGDALVATKVADDDNWREIKGTLLRNVAMGATPVIRVVDADHGRRGELLLRHEHDGRDLHLDYAERTLGYVRQLWGRAVLLDTQVDGGPGRLKSNDDGFDVDHGRA